jgi:hypothetical protein
MDQIYAALQRSDAWLQGIGLGNREVVFGLLVGVLAYLVQTWTRVQAARRQVRDQMFALLSQILDVKSQLAIIRAEGMDPVVGQSPAYNPRVQAIADRLSLLCLRANDLHVDERAPLADADAALLAEGLGAINHPAAEKYWERALRADDDPATSFTLRVARGLQLYDWGRTEEARKLFDALRDALGRGAAGPDFLGRAFHAQALREGPLAREHYFNEASRRYSLIENENLRTFRQGEVERDRKRLGAGSPGA